MTKADIVNEIAKTTGIEKATVLETLEKFMEIVKDSLAASSLRPVLRRLPETSRRTLQLSSRNTKSRLSSPRKCSWKMSSNLAVRDLAKTHTALKCVCNKLFINL